MPGLQSRPQTSTSCRLRWLVSAAHSSVERTPAQTSTMLALQLIFVLKSFSRSFFLSVLAQSCSTVAQSTC